MSFSLAQILLFIVAYLTALFTVAHLADRGVIPARITRHPATYVLSLGVFAGAMASNGVMELAQRYGYSFLMYYLGVVLLFVLATLLLFPLLRLCRVYQLTSLADVLSFRFRSSWVGAGITLAMCITVLPLLALQIQAVADSVHVLSGNGEGMSQPLEQERGLAQLFCIIITIFSILFGTRHLSSQDRNTGLVTAIAFESLVKLGALLILMLVCVYQVFGGFGEMQLWLHQNPDVAGLRSNLLQSDNARALLLVFFAGAVCMPHIFHMAFAENTDSRDLNTASWGLPLYLLLLSLPVLPVLWAGIKLDYGGTVDYTAIGVGLILRSDGVATMAFVAHRPRTEHLHPAQVAATGSDRRPHTGRLQPLHRSRRAAKPHPAGLAGLYRHPAIPARCDCHPLLVPGQSQGPAGGAGRRSGPVAGLPHAAGSGGLFPHPASIAAAPDTGYDG
jgi:Na+/proline symporter